jgi:WD40 repeat protein
VRAIESSAVLRDDRKALATWEDKSSEVQLWDLVEGRPGERITCTAGEPFNTIVWGHDGAFLACIVATAVDLVDLARHDRWHTDVALVEEAAFSPDGLHFVWGNDNGTGELLDPRARRRQASFNFRRGEAAAMIRFFFNPDSRTVAVVESAQALHLRDTKTGKERVRLDLGPMGAPDAPAVAFSADGALLAFPDAHGIKVVDGHTGATKKSLVGTAKDRAPPSVLAFSPDASSLVTVSRERVEVWDLKSGKSRASLAKDSAGGELTLSPDGAQAAFGGGDEASWLWDLQGSDAKPLGNCMALTFTRDGAKVRCTTSDSAKRPWTERFSVFDVKTGAPVPKSGRAIPGHDEPFLADPEGAARLVRVVDGAALRFATVTLGDRRLPIVVADDGHFSGDRDAARKLLFRTGAAGAEEPLPDAELATLESKSLLADFVAGRPLAAP